MSIRKFLIWAIAAIAAVSLAISFWLDISNGQSVARSLVLAACYLVAIATIIKTKLVRLPSSLHFPILTLGFRPLELAKAIGYFLIAFIWVYFAAGIRSDSWWAAGAVFGVPILLILVGGMAVVKSLGPGDRR